jgi:CTD kinase subunit alpha
MKRCIALELFITKPVFQGHDEISQLQVIWDVLGTPDSHGWASVEELPWYELVRPKVSVPDKFDASFQKWLPTGNAMALVKGMLAFDPVKRISAAQAMKHEYFEEEPQAEVPDMTGMGEWHEMDAKMVRRKKEGR